jgi:hypothetical protein
VFWALTRSSSFTMENITNSCSVRPLDAAVLLLERIYRDTYSVGPSDAALI